MKIDREKVIFDPKDPREGALRWKTVWAFDNYLDGAITRGIYYGESASQEHPFDCGDSVYRFIAPIEEPKYRPFANAEEFAPHRDKWIKVLSSNDGFERVGAYYNDGVRSSKAEFVTYEELLERGEFEDGSPCGVEEV